MDALLEHLQGFLPYPFLQFLHQNILHPQSALQILQHRALHNIRRGVRMAYPLVERTVDRVTLALYNSPDVVVLVFILVSLAFVLQMLIWFKRILAWWTKLTFRLLFWACVAGLMAMVWQRGLEASLRDAVVIGGKVAGYAVVLKDIWVREYRRYEAQAQGARAPPPNMRVGKGRAGIR